MSLRSSTIVLLALTACDSLGNPDLGSTPSAIWESQVAELVTTARSVSAAEGRRLIEDRTVLHHVDQHAPSTGAFVRIEVRARWHTPRTGEVGLVTVLELRDGSRVSRIWHAPAALPAYRAVFGAAAKARAAVTRLAP